MESIYILQKTYENLYALSFPVLDFLEVNLPRISNTWKRTCVYDVLEKDFPNGDITKRELKEFDIYYLLKILLDEKNWNDLKNLDASDDFYTDYHHCILRDVKDIRNTVRKISITGRTLFQKLQNFSEKILTVCWQTCINPKKRNFSISFASELLILQ